MKTDQPALLQKYMMLRIQSVRLVSMARQLSGAGFGRCPRAAFDDGKLRRVDRRVVARLVAEPVRRIPTPTPARGPPAGRSRTASPAQPRALNGRVSATISTGATAPPQRPNVQTIPWARPRSANGNQLRVPRAMFG